VELHQFSASFRAIGFDLELIGTGYQPGLPALSLALAGTNLVFAWPVDSGGGFGLYSSTNLTSPSWLPETVMPWTNGSQVMATQTFDTSARFFRLQKP
jgi:hypothetical protein